MTLCKAWFVVSCCFLTACATNGIDRDQFRQSILGITDCHTIKEGICFASEKWTVDEIERAMSVLRSLSGKRIQLNNVLAVQKINKHKLPGEKAYIVNVADLEIADARCNSWQGAVEEYVLTLLDHEADAIFEHSGTRLVSPGICRVDQ